MRQIQIEASKRGARLFRNNVGLFKTSDGRSVRTGLATGSSDLIGWTKTGRFLAVEVKSASGKVSKAQMQFMEAVRRAGGISACCRTVHDFLQLLRQSGGGSDYGGIGGSV